MNNNRIRVAIQKSGRLSDASFRLLSSSGISLNPGKEELFCRSSNFPLDLLLIRDDDIPTLVSEGICDYGILGTNVLQEKSFSYPASIPIIRQLGFAFCRLSLAVPDGFQYQNLKSLDQFRIATSYPNLLSDFMKKNEINAEIMTLSGSVEIAPRLGMADAICDLVSTGATLKANHLKEVETILVSQAVLIKTTKKFPPQKREAAQKFETLM